MLMIITSVFIDLQADHEPYFRMFQRGGERGVEILLIRNM